MEGAVTNLIPLLAFTFLVALVYSAVGHGGASGYLALLALYSFPKESASASALCLNLLVSGTAFWAFWKARHFSWPFTWPFVLTSVPVAFLGGLIKISPSLYSFLLASVLFFAGFRLLIEIKTSEKQVCYVPSLSVSLPIGAFIGVLSGIVGVGGGIFLSPFILFLHWAEPKRTAATSAFFILVNSFAGLLGRAFRYQFRADFPPLIIWMVATAFLGGIWGSHLGANHFSGQWLKRILAVVLFVASYKLFRVIF